MKKRHKFLPKLMGLKLNSLFFINPQSALEQAFVLFCTPRRGKPKEHQIPFLNSAKTKKIKIDGIFVKLYNWHGTGKKVLLLHGWESNTYRWKDLIERLQVENYDITAIDAPAHGNSGGKLFNAPLYAKFVEATIQQNRIEILIGHSVGAMTAVFQQHRAPADNVSKMILLGPPSELSRIMEDFQSIMGFHQKFMRGLENLFFEKFGFTFTGFSTAGFAKSLSMKGLIIHDKFDKIVPLSASTSIAKNWKNSRLIITEGMGHSLNNAYILDEIIDFLKAV